MMKVLKRDGRIEDFNAVKIEVAIEQAMRDSNVEVKDSVLKNIVEEIVVLINEDTVEGALSVDTIHGKVAEVLIANDFVNVFDKYVRVREDRFDARTLKSDLFKVFDNVVHVDPNDDSSRENANVDSNGAMAKMLNFGATASKKYAHLKLLSPEASKAHLNGDIHVHDLDFYSTGTLTCVQIDLIDLFDRGFNTGHGFIRPPKSIRSAAALVAIVLQSGQNSQHGGIAIHSLDYGLAPFVNKTFRKELTRNIKTAQKYTNVDIEINVEKYNYCHPNTIEYDNNLRKLCEQMNFTVATAILDDAIKYTKKEVFQAMEALIFNLNTLHSRAGSQTPFSSVNYGTDTSHAGQLVIKYILKATSNGLGENETPIFPIQIFRLKTGVSLNPGDPNYFLFQKACETSAKRIYPNFLNLDAPYNSNPTETVNFNANNVASVYWNKIKHLPENRKWVDPVTGGDIRAMAATMGCRTRVLSNNFDPERPYAAGRGNASFTTINLPRLAIDTVLENNVPMAFNENNEIIIESKNLDLETKNNLIEKFIVKVDEMMKVSEDQLIERLNFQKKMKAKNLPFLFTQGVWIDSKNYKSNDSIEGSVNHATVSVGFFGLAEALVALIGEHHGESTFAQKTGLNIIHHMRERLDRKAIKEKRNWSLLATPAEGIAGRFVSIDREKYGVILGVTDRDYYTNGNHVPVHYSLTAFEKITVEAPYNELTNAGHILYVEMDGDPSKNVEAFESIVRAAVKQNAGYIAINHSLDSHKRIDGGCGFHGIIHNECPRCGEFETDGAIFERLRRVTGYLTSDVKNMNNAKQAEIKDRVKHVKSK